MKIYYGSTDTLNNYETDTNLHLKVIGSFRENYRNQLVVSCSNCNDKELYRTCLFQTTERQYLKGMKPCGCAKAVYWEDWQAELILQRRASLFGYSFLGWEGDYRGSLTPELEENLKIILTRFWRCTTVHQGRLFTKGMSIKEIYV